MQIDALAPGATLPPALPEVAHARATLAAFAPPDAPQEREREGFLAFIDEYPADAHLRSCRVGHLTAAVLLMSADGERVLMMHHKKLDRWLQFGGHCDGDANLRGVALRETVEESGIRPAFITREPVDIDIHEIPEYRGVPAHLHYDVRFLAWAPEGAKEIANEESLALRWHSRSEVDSIGVDPSLQRLLLLGFAAHAPRGQF